MPNWIVNASVSPPGSGTVTGTGEYADGSTVTLTAVPQGSSLFINWGVNGYTLLDYIQSSGTQSIDTGVSCTSTVDFEVQSAFIDIAGSQTIIGSTTAYHQSKFGKYNNQYWIRWAEGGTGTGAIDTNFHTYKKTGTYLYKDDSHIGYAGTSYSGTNISLFMQTGYGDNATMKLSYCKMWDNNTLVRNFVPVIRNSDSAVGLLDLVNMKFYGNSGTGTFTAGTSQGNIVFTDNPFSFTAGNDISFTAFFEKQANCRIKVNGSWIDGMMYLKVNGQWVQGTPWIKINGQWKEGS